MILFTDTKDMTTGKPLPLIISFAIPMLISSIFQQLYTAVDTLIISQYLGSKALAGVGATNIVIFLALCLAIGMGNGGGLIIAQCYGGNDRVKMWRTIVAMTWIMAALAVIMSIAGYLFCEPVMRMLKVPEDVLPYSVSYIRIIFVFTGGTVIYNWASSILRSVGDSRTPLYALVAASFINIGLDLLLIINFGMGVEGAASATVFSQFVSGFICLYVLVRDREKFGFDKTSLFPDRHNVWQVIKTSIPSTFQSCMIALGMISVQRLINTFGADVMAGYTAASKVDSLAIQVILSVGNSLCVFTGQNIGAGKLDRVKVALKQSRIVMLISAVIIAVCAYVFRFNIMGLFINPEDSLLALETGAQYLSIIGVAYLICAVMQSYQNVIRGAGDVNTCMVAGLTELAGKIFFAYLLSPIMGALGIWLSTPLSWSCGCVIPVVRYYTGKWQDKRLID
ncbi:MATE family efflux transporter [Butyrivibrio sp. CB08]|uniref:MATE family efflux transporter n=1 Tax=Butyrivibrio sp. CB08 TaxID=2364879 RepID=UPI000EA9A689|nr:MATE family efflux transporter [Butyrivibrio sp. CB08]RKM60430.1 MATE family efflux transporter [Butyrivibrio sp. CB08]